MSHRKRSVLSLLLLLVLLGACGGASQPGDVPTRAGEVPRITVEELKALLDAGQEVIVADSRSRRSYEIRHIEGAISMPIQHVAKRNDELPKDKKIVFYCT